MLTPVSDRTPGPSLVKPPVPVRTEAMARYCGPSTVSVLAPSAISPPVPEEGGDREIVAVQVERAAGVDGQAAGRRQRRVRAEAQDAHVHDRAPGIGLRALQQQYAEAHLGQAAHARYRHAQRDIVAVGVEGTATGTERYRTRIDVIFPSAGTQLRRPA